MNGEQLTEMLRGYRKTYIARGGPFFGLGMEWRREACERAGEVGRNLSTRREELRKGNPFGIDAREERIQSQTRLVEQILTFERNGRRLCWRVS